MEDLIAKLIQEKRRYYLTIVYKNAYMNSEIAEDLLQDATYKALKYKDRFFIKPDKTPDQCFKPWFVSIIKNTIIDHLRKEDKYYVNNTSLFLERSDFLETPVKSEVDTATPINQTDNSITEDIVKAISEINPKYSVPFQLHFNGYSYDEIAERLQRPRRQMVDFIRVARVQLQSKLAIYQYR